MVEDIPLTIDLLQRAVGVVGSIGGYQLRAVLVQDDTTRVDEHTTSTPPERHGPRGESPKA